MQPASVNPARYVEERDGAYRVAGSRVSLDSIVYAFRQGQTPESIMQSFPSLSLEQFYGAITYYLANRDDVDGYLAARRSEYEAARKEARAKDPAFYEKLASAKLSS